MELDTDASIEWEDTVVHEPAREPDHGVPLLRMKPTRDLRPAGGAPVLSASVLRGLAIALDRLVAFHKERGGASPDMPELHRVEAARGRISAFVRSGVNEFRLELVRDAWIFAE